MMKEFKLIFFLLLMVNALFAQDKIPYSRTGMVEFVAGDKNTLTVVSKASAEKENNAISYAQRNAIENILFRGIPGSNQENPMIADEDKARCSALDKLIQGGGYIKYLTNAVVVDKVKKKKIHYVTVETTFDINAIRKYLEENGIVRKFGF